MQLKYVRPGLFDTKLLSVYLVVNESFNGTYWTLTVCQEKCYYVGMDQEDPVNCKSCSEFYSNLSISHIWERQYTFFSFPKLLRSKNTGRANGNSKYK
jgi:hypothetical protein